MSRKKRAQNRRAAQVGRHKKVAGARARAVRNPAPQGSSLRDLAGLIASLEAEGWAVVVDIVDPFCEAA